MLPDSCIYSRLESKRISFTMLVGKGADQRRDAACGHWGEAAVNVACTNPLGFKRQAPRPRLISHPSIGRGI